MISDGIHIGGLVIAWPAALTALALVPAAIWLVRREARQRAIAATLLGGPWGGAAGARPRIAALLVVIAIALAVGAFARPRWGVRAVPLEQRGIDVVIALDVSRSMQARDLAPSRAAAAATALEALLSHLQGNRVGLVTFAGDTFERAPLTLDTAAVSSLVRRAQQEQTLVHPGSDPAEAILTALRTLDVPNPAATRAIVIVSDGELAETDMDAVERAADQARRAGVRVYGAFAAGASPVALPVESGGTDTTEATRQPLELLAERTGGQVRELGAVPGLAVEFRRLQQTQFDQARRNDLAERYPWFAGGALAALLLSSALGGARRPHLRGTRRGAARATHAAAAAITALGLMGCGTSLYREVSLGNDLYTDGRYEEALAAYDRAAALAPDDAAVAYNRGLSLDALARHETARQALSDGLQRSREPALTQRLQFAAGNNALLREDWTAARDRFIAVLRADPTDADAKANLELALRHIPPAREPAPSPDGGGLPGSAPGEPGGAQGGGQRAGGTDRGQPAQPGTGNAGTPGGTAAPGAPTGTATSPVPPPTQALLDAQAALDAAIAALGPEVSRDEAARLLELARLANELRGLARAGGGGGAPPAR